MNLYGLVLHGLVVNVLIWIAFVDMKMWIIMNKRRRMRKRLIHIQIIFIHCMLLLVLLVKIPRPNLYTVVLIWELSLMLLTSLHQIPAKLVFLYINSVSVTYTLNGIYSQCTVIQYVSMKICCLEVSYLCYLCLCCEALNVKIDFWIKKFEVLSLLLRCLMIHLFSSLCLVFH